MKTFSIKKFFTFPKVFLFCCGLIGVLSVVAVLYFYFSEPWSEPYSVRITNITDRSATVSWVTDEKTKGVVIYGEKDNFGPWVFAKVGKKIAYDDRDVAEARLQAADEEKSKIEDIDSFEVDYSEVDEKIVVEELGKYYVHHVTLTNLDPESAYYFKIGNVLRFVSPDVSEDDGGFGGNKVETFEELDELPLPNPAYGVVKKEVKNEEYELLEDSLVYLTPVIPTEYRAGTMLSSVTGENGSWYIDLSASRDVETGELLDDYEEDDGQLISVEAGPQGEIKEFGNPASWDTPAQPFIIWMDESGSSDESSSNPRGEVRGLVSFLGDFITPVLASCKDECMPSCMSGACAQCPDNDNDGKPDCPCDASRSWEKGCPAGCEAKCASLGSGDDGGDDVDCKWELKTEPGVGEQFCKVEKGSQCCYVCYRNAYQNNCSGEWKRDGEFNCYQHDSSGACAGEAPPGENGSPANSGQEPPSSGTGGGPVHDREDVPSGCDISEWTNQDISDGECCGWYNEASCTCSCSGGTTKSVGWGQKCDCSGVGGECCVKYDRVHGYNCPSGDYLELKVYTVSEKTGSSCSAGTASSGGICNYTGTSMDAVYKCPDGSYTRTKSDCCNTGGLACCYSVKETGDGWVRYETPTECPRSCNDCPGDYIWSTAPTTAVCSGLNVQCDDGTYVSSSSSCPEGTGGDGKKKCGDPGTVGQMGSYGGCEHAFMECVQNGTEYECQSVKIEVPDIPPSGCTNPGMSGSDGGCPFESQVCVERSDGVRTCETRVGGATGGISLVCGTMEGTKGKKGSEGGCSDDEVCAKGALGWGCVKTVSQEVPVFVIPDLDLESPGTYLIQRVRAESIMLSPFEGIYLLNQTGRYCMDYKDERYCFDIEVPGSTLLYVDENENEQYDEGVDTNIADDAVEIEVSKESVIRNYAIYEGFNIVSFDVVDMDGGTMASDVISYLNDEYDDNFYSIAMYDGGWNIVGNRDGEVYGGENDFQIIPGRGYLLRAKNDIVAKFIGKSVAEPVPVYMREGWNLVGIAGSDQSYTATSWIDSIDEIDGLDADNVTRWDLEKSKYEGLQKEEDDDGTIQVYGFDFPIEDRIGYFVRIASGSGTWTPY
ncbi:fibronectin type III domain-containing protein [Candidatus Dojkabacteria bacterium]|nr:fibronectin type III domain-containing protein [Candidatus Dojkabacteria bacterium]